MIPHYSNMAVVGRLESGAVGHRARFAFLPTDDGPYGQARTRGAVFARCAPYPADDDDPTLLPPEGHPHSAGWALHCGAQPCPTCYPPSTTRESQ